MFRANLFLEDIISATKDYVSKVQDLNSELDFDLTVVFATLWLPRESNS